jgi:hypothetical protein
LNRNLSVITAPPSDEYELVDGSTASDLIFYLRFAYPASIEYRRVEDPTSFDGLFEKVPTFDNVVYRPATSRQTELYEIVSRRSRTVYSAILADELRPDMPVYVLKDKQAARSERTRRAHAVRSAIEAPKQDRMVYQTSHDVRSNLVNYRLPIQINLSNDENPEEPPDVPVRSGTLGRDALARERNDSSTDESGLPTYRQPDRRRVQSNAETVKPAPPLPARSGTKPSSDFNRNSAFFDSRPNAVPNAGEPRARSATVGRRPPEADQLTASEWTDVQTWMLRQISRVQAEQVLMER